MLCFWLTSFEALGCLSGMARTGDVAWMDYPTAKFYFMAFWFADLQCIYHFNDAEYRLLSLMPLRSCHQPGLVVE